VGGAGDAHGDLAPVGDEQPTDHGAPTPNPVLVGRSAP
jgi:hypothetical protein